jgi:hypothetical protein
MTIKRWIVFREQNQKKKTKVFGVFSNCSDDFIGEIKWHPQWRHYCFFPFFDTLYSDRCLITIADFVTNLNKKHKEEKVIIW